MSSEDKGVTSHSSYGDKLAYIKEELAVDKNFDIICLEMVHANRKMALFLVDGFGKDSALTQIQRELSHTTEEEVDESYDALIKSRIPYAEIDQEEDLDTAIDQVLSGPAILLVEGLAYCIIIDTREYPVRGPEEPDTEKVVRGSRDGLVETLVMSAALIRRRIRDRTFRVEYQQIGRRSKTDTALLYIADIADPDYVHQIRESIKAIDTDGLPMADKTIEEYVFKEGGNPYPLVRYSERPDVCATHLYEGHVILLVDGSPSAMITPTTFWNLLQHAEEYRQKPVIGALLRIVRFSAVFISLFLLPIWYMLATHQELVPEAFSFIGTQEEGSIPLFIQFLIAEAGIEMLRMASIHTPNAVAEALGLVAALLIGDIAIQVGMFSPEVILYLAIAAVGTFATPSYELSLANRFMRLLFLIATAAFGPVGFVSSATIWFIALVRLRGLRVPYMWPFIPFNMKALRDVFFRIPMPLKNRRPAINHPQDPDR
ncbi:spore germination protein [Shouchella lehensis]|uniref:Spore germination protein n=1 Tax=Shouchella lehensis TaxID=300825 RepID=A0A4Y7WIX8_9BACI|nr:spore germination protein [Shouchella lehensis]MBG9785739.1 spore gernimation protein GerA [Shouchella lehensis]TES48204.1 spore germination protein [Shouchella lehensis]